VIREHAIELSTGTLRLRVSNEALPLGQVLDFAARRNPRRGFLFVAKSIGRYLAAEASMLMGHCDSLARQLSSSLSGPILFVGVAEAGIALAHGVFEAYGRLSGRDDIRFWHSSRLKLDIDPICAFSEPHSHAPAHYLYAKQGSAFAESLREVQTLVLIDDEITTGATMKGLYEALSPHLTSLTSVKLVALSDWSDSEICVGGASPHVLISGTYDFTRRAQHAPPVRSELTGGECTVPCAFLHNQGRLGLMGSLGELAPSDFGLRLQRGKRVLVVGTGEHQWGPIKLAQSLRALGMEAWFQATTRAPVHLEGPIRSKLEFGDSYGETLSESLYNFDPADWDQILIFSETPEHLGSAELQRLTGGQFVHWPVHV